MHKLTEVHGHRLTYIYIYFLIQDLSDLQNSPSEQKQNEKAVLARVWGNLDSKYMKPLLTHSRPTLLDTLPVCCNPIARLLTTTEQMTQVIDTFALC